MRMYCGLCSYEGEHQLFRSDGGSFDDITAPNRCPECEMHAPWLGNALSDDEVLLLDQAFDDLSDRVAQTAPQLVGSIVYNGGSLSQDLLDLLVLLYGHSAITAICLYDAPPDLVAKAEAYCRAECLTVIEVDNDFKAAASLQPWTLNIPRLQAREYPHSRSGTLAFFLEYLGEVEAYHILRSPTARRLATSLLPRERPGALGEAIAQQEAWRLLRSAARDELLAAAVGGAPLLPTILQPWAIGRFVEQSPAQPELRATTAESWWSRQRLRLPQNFSAERILEFRQSLSRADFLEVITSAVDHTAGPATASELSARVDAALQKRLDVAAGDSRSMRVVDTVASGVVASAGALVGGTTGAIIGGVGAASASLLVQWLDRAMRSTWTDLFLDAERG
jgi:hypothetical protein